MNFDKIVKVTASHVAKGQQERREWDRHTAWYLSEFWAYEQGDDHTPSRVGTEAQHQLTMETNYPFAFLDTMAAGVVPQNPRLTLTARVPEFQKAAKARQALVNDTLRAEKMHNKAWEAALRAGICGRCWGKVVWDVRLRRPVVRVIDPRRVFYDRSTDPADMRYIIEAVPLTEEEFKRRVADPNAKNQNGRIYDPEAAEGAKASLQPEWMFDRVTQRNYADDGVIDEFKWIVVYEFYDLVEERFYHFLEGAKKPLIEGELPYRYVKNPFVLLTFNSNLRDSGGVSDVKLIENPQKRLNEVDTLELWYALASIPKPIINEAMLDHPEQAISGLQDCDGPGKAWKLRASMNGTPVPIDSIIGYTKPPANLPSFDKMREVATRTIEFTLGLPQYQRGVTGTSEVATDLALVDAATKTRNGRRIKAVRDWIVDIGERIIGLWKEYLTIDSSMFVREKSNGTPIEVDRALLAFPEDPYVDDEESASDDWAFEMEAAMDNPSENNRAAQISRLQTFVEVLLADQSGVIDKAMFYRKLAELLELDEIISTNPQAAGPMQFATPGGGQQIPLAANMGPTDTIAGGAMPEGLDSQPLLPPGASALASQPKVSA